MATRVFRPHDILQAPIPAIGPRRKPSPVSHRRPRPEGRKQRKRANSAGRDRRTGRKGGEMWKQGEAAAQVYAGTGFSNSPSPSALPLPRFSLKKDAPAVGEYLATVALRRMLRLE
ncbi:hypothetical protein OPV22_004843 [Ensete ventricosum]|uniref:Uncharacterized protein n=1 Tax=Ensete ventricosum TaxID=4639 RepID=A0AAV8RHJ4_ENSVE|nr:hypothetical protein OPV22_004843 [Ensete ventricosum]